MKLLAILTCGFVLPASASLLYNNTIRSGPASGIGPISQCGPGGCVQGLGISLDDALVPIARNPLGLALNIQQVIVGISGTPNQAVTFTLWPSPAPGGSPAIPPQQLGRRL